MHLVGPLDNANQFAGVLKEKKGQDTDKAPDRCGHGSPYLFEIK